jgi:hypothetical protein
MALLALVLNRTARPLGWALVAVTLLTLAVGGLAPPSTTAQQSTNPATNQGRRISLRDQLTSGLRAITKADLAFIDKVVLKVEQGKLPRRLVDSTFLWARDRAARRGPTRALRPMIYFQPALVARAKRIGVQL